ncbi:aryl-alcohol dehydrogenase-like predicted oxidoreductase [Microbacterium terrae]|uniref:General stress protein 69 n=1 Tax=Microbacterium terrae TaxID=69369 RepID=A0A0M2HLN0_9MICO|nr:aldo/keto reductase [Microbacterium terrae]KJL45330.1 General stress protein 69 [Microbacterium terrae]MBP1078422.1 aryl-alcohol dehydrogenase-like predicted oxidoreductase [Microbacterium terrae]GLJ99322.1 aldo/keto reductase [Microbacterium terrae]
MTAPTDAATTIRTGRLGRSGVPVSRLTLGTMNFGGPTSREDSIAIVHAAIDAGVTLIDTADAYLQGLSEEILGQAIAGRRDELVIATKFHGRIGENPLNAGNSRRWISQAVEGSLTRLGVDHIDIYQAHRPDPHTDLLETITALSDLVRAGKIRYYGTSTFSAEDVVAAQHLAREHGLVAPLTEQVPYSALVRLAERTTLPIARRYGLGVLAYGPLAAGWLSGAYRRGAPQPQSARAAQAWAGRFDVDDPANAAKLTAAERLAVLADEAGLTLPSLALAFALTHPDVSSVIVGPRTRAHLDAYVAASAVVLDDDLLDEIDRAIAPGTTFLERDNGRISASLTSAARRRTHD